MIDMKNAFYASSGFILDAVVAVEAFDVKIHVMRLMCVRIRAGLMII